MDRAAANVQAMLPALLFLCAGVPLAALLDRLGFFEAVAVEIEHRWDRIPVAVLWWLAAATTVVLNLDTTVVLLTPLYIRLARRSGVDPLPLALVPLLLASLASSALPVSNLTNLIAADRYGLSVADVASHLAPVSIVGCTVGWLLYRRRFPTALAGSTAGAADRRIIGIGSLVVAALLAGFVIGPRWGLQPWMAAAAADAVLMIVTRWVPWRDVPIVTAAGIAAVAALAAVIVSPDRFGAMLAADSPPALAGLMMAGSVGANAINNLPALLVAIDSTATMTWGVWAWLAGVNTGAALLPVGALANVLWWRILRDEDVPISLRSSLQNVVPIALPALAAGAVALAATRALAG
ncbi:MAG: citrate transporter [Actinobacteria bacterium]|nr:citrate transporter [Actinomycetota bacterium]